MTKVMVDRTDPGVYWLSSSGPVSVSMLLLSVSEAKVCSVDMDEMSFAEDDWEAEPDTTSGTSDAHTHTHTKESREVRCICLVGSFYSRLSSDA